MGQFRPRPRYVLLNGRCSNWLNIYQEYPYAVPQVDVCDKVEVSSRDPSLDSSYYSSFVYTLMDGSGEEIAFDSTPAKDPTGEVQVRR